MTEPTVEPTRPRRATTADWLETIRELTTRHPSEAWVNVEITDAAKGEVRVVTKISAPLGADPDELENHAAAVVAIAVRAHDANTARRGPAGE